MKISVTILTIILTFSFIPTHLLADSDDQVTHVNHLKLAAKKEQKTGETETNIGIPIPTGNGGGKFPPDDPALTTLSNSVVALLCKVGFC